MTTRSIEIAASKADAPALEALEPAEGRTRDRIVERPDGFHWIAPDGHQEFGPLETVEQDMAEMIDAADEDAPEPGETLQEAESEIGMADWIDPQTGEPAEGSCPPHLEPE